MLQIRALRGHGLHAKCVKQYLVQWAPSLLPVKELRYAHETWEIVKALQDVHADAEKGETLRQTVMVEWAPSWIASSDFGPSISTSDSASHLLIE